MVVLVTGGRDYPNRAAVFAKLDELHAETPITKIVHGACTEPHRKHVLRGTDRWAQEWALTREIAYAGYPARWLTYGKRAGPIRNREMPNRERIDCVVAAPGGSGTAGMVEIAERYDLPIHRITE